MHSIIKHTNNSSSSSSSSSSSRCPGCPDSWRPARSSRWSASAWSDQGGGGILYYITRIIV